jgi:hypothetical protein
LQRNWLMATIAAFNESLRSYSIHPFRLAQFPDLDLAEVVGQ